MTSQLVLVKVPPGVSPGLFPFSAFFSYFRFLIHHVMSLFHCLYFNSGSTIQVDVGGRLLQAQVPPGVTEFYINVDNKPSATHPQPPPQTEYDTVAERAIPAIINMISGCADSQTSADVFDTSNFRLPRTMGRAGGACTSALLQVLYKISGNTPQDGYGTSWVDVLREMRAVLLNMGAYQFIYFIHS